MGSVDNENWVKLHARDTDDGQWATEYNQPKTWQLDASAFRSVAPKGFRYFRLTVTGPSDKRHTNVWAIMISGIEIYGALYE